MTLQQLKYIIMVAETGTITEAASRLFISQPSLTNAIHELEKEMNITIFDRTNKGIHISKDGEDFLGYARQVLEQATLLEDRYKGGNGGKQEFCVSTQHYSFAVNAFVDLIEKYGHDVVGWKSSSLDRFPVLIKFIDAKKDLSIQIHPDDDYALEIENEFGKNEMWYVVDCEPGAFLYCGLKKDSSKEEIRERIENNTITDILNKIEVHKGDCVISNSNLTTTINHNNAPE